MQRSLYILIRHCNEMKLKFHSNRYCDFFTKSNQTGKKLHYNRLIDVSDNQMKTTWNIIKNVRQKLHNSDHMPPSFKTDNVEVLPDKASGAFNSHFLNITESLNIQNVKDNSPI